MSSDVAVLETRNHDGGTMGASKSNGRMVPNYHQIEPFRDRLYLGTISLLGSFLHFPNMTGCSLLPQLGDPSDTSLFSLGSYLLFVFFVESLEW